MKCILLVMLLNPKLFAAVDLISMKAQKIMSSRSKSQLLQNAQKFDRLSFLDKKCSDQINTRSVPLACYELLQKKKSSSMISKVEFERAMAQLDQICTSNVQNLSNKNQYKDLNGTLLGKGCKAAYKGLKNKYQYAHPEAQFLNNLGHEQL